MVFGTFLTSRGAVAAMDTAVALSSLSPIPAVSVIPGILQEIQKVVQDAKNNKDACRRLAEKCSAYADMFMKHVEDISGTAMHSPVVDAERLLTTAKQKMQTYSAWGFWRTLFHGDKMEDEFRRCSEDLDRAMADFSVTSFVQIYVKLDDMADSLGGELSEVRKSFAEVLKRTGPSLQPMSRDEAIDYMQKAKTMLGTLGDLSDENDSQLQVAGVHVNRTQFNVIVNQIAQSLLEVQRQTLIAHKITVLEDKVRLVSDRPVSSDSRYTDVYRGLYLIKQKVAVRCFRDKTDADKAVTRLKKEATTWSQLNHPNVQPLIGIMEVTIGSLPCAALVSPWHEHGNITEYTRRDPTYNKFNLLASAAAGLAYLHGRRVFHGNIKGTNVLITSEYEAVISDFHMSKIATELTRNTSAILSVTRDTSPRWMAPELFDPAENPKTPGEPYRPDDKTDVWSFGMVILEVLTGKQPWEECRNPHSIPVSLIQGRRPRRPDNVWITDDVWDLLQQCWRPGRERELRPDMTALREHLLRASAAHKTRYPPTIIKI